MELYEYTCENCGLRFRAPATVAGSWLLMKSAGTGALAIMPTVDFPVLDEVRALVDALPLVRGRADYEIGDATQAVLSVVFDADPDGSPYVVGGKPRCPRCGSDRMGWWQSTDPLEFIQQEVAVASHEQWDRLTLDEKRERLRQAILDYLSS